MKHIAKDRQGRLLRAVAAVASSVHRTVVGRTAEVRTHLSRTFTRSMRATSQGIDLRLVPAHAGHFDWLSGIVREGAAGGSFDAELATDSLEARMFFANLRRALETGYLVTQSEGAAPAQAPASGYVYLLSRESREPVPVGFAMFKSIGGLGFELWLVGIDRRYRGRGFTRKLLRAALATPAGMLAHVARVNRAGRDAEAMGKALLSAGYREERQGHDVRWFVRRDAPEALARVVRTGGARLAGA